MPKRLPGDFPPRFLELPPVFLDAHLTARAAAGGGLNRAETTERRNTAQRGSQTDLLCCHGPCAQRRDAKGGERDGGQGRDSMCCFSGIPSTNKKCFKGAGDLAQWLYRLPRKHKDQSLIPSAPQKVLKKENEQKLGLTWKTHTCMTSPRLTVFAFRSPDTAMVGGQSHGP